MKGERRAWVQMGMLIIKRLCSGETHGCNKAKICVKSADNLRKLIKISKFRKLSAHPHYKKTKSFKPSFLFHQLLMPYLNETMIVIHIN